MSKFGWSQGFLYENLGEEIIILKFKNKGYFQDGNIHIPARIEGVPVGEIGKAAFKDCDFITTVIVPPTVVEICDFAFANCKNLSYAIIADTVVRIGEGAFSGCTQLKTVNIPEELKHIEENMFANCSSLERIYIPDSVTSIGDSAFKNCENLDEINLPNDNIVKMGSDIFNNCVSMLPEQATDIKTMCFELEEGIR